MLRIIKKYRLQFREGPQEDYPPIAGNNLVFSSYPGTIFSGDDFYILGSGLVTLETTIGNKNPALWKYVQPQGCVLEWIRNVVANRLALDGATWADVFKQFNSGTYNNQWMIVDYKAFVPHGPSPGSRVLTILEQIPGMVVVADKTAELYKTTYWASYNIPYFETVFNASGLQDLVAQYGDWFSYTKNPRAKIFQRDQSLVEDMGSMVRLMRYNDFLHDPLSLCEAPASAAAPGRSPGAREGARPVVGRAGDEAEAGAGAGTAAAAAATPGGDGVADAADPPAGGVGRAERRLVLRPAPGHLRERAPPLPVALSARPALHALHGPSFFNDYSSSLLSRGSCCFHCSEDGQLSTTQST